MIVAIMGFLMVAWLLLVSFMIWYLKELDKEIGQINRRLSRIIRSKE